MDNMKKKAMLSQPMAGKSDVEIVATRERAVAALEAKGYAVVNTLFTDDWYGADAMKARGVVQIPLIPRLQQNPLMRLVRSMF